MRIIPSLNQLLDPGPTGVYHPAVNTTIRHTYPAVGITHTEVSHPAVSTLVPHTYPAVSIIHTGAFHPAVSTLVIYTCPAGSINLVGITLTRESDTNTTEVQRALIIHLPHPPVAL